MRQPDVFDRYDAEEDPVPWEPREPRCKFCGSTDVRWRQQTGKWVMFSLKPGVEHRCLGRGAADVSEFD